VFAAADLAHEGGDDAGADTVYEGEIGVTGAMFFALEFCDYGVSPSPEFSHAKPRRRKGR
jgi:hypothetical protein